MLETIRIDTRKCIIINDYNSGSTLYRVMRRCLFCLQVKKIFVAPGNTGIKLVDKVQLVELNIKNIKVYT